MRWSLPGTISPSRSRSSRVMRCSDSIDAHHREIRHELVVGVHEQLGPRALDRHRFDRASVAREPPVLDDAARLEQRDRAPIRDAVERHRQLELVGAHAEAAQVIATRSESPASWNSGSVGCSDAKSMSRSRQDEHASALDAPVHAPRHLQDLVRAEVQPA